MFIYKKFFKKKFTKKNICIYLIKIWFQNLGSNLIKNDQSQDFLITVTTLFQSACSICGLVSCTKNFRRTQTFQKFGTKFDQKKEVSRFFLKINVTILLSILFNILLVVRSIVNMGRLQKDYKTYQWANKSGKLWGSRDNKWGQL